MKIESIIRREGGTKVTLQGTTYHFQPDADGRHVADVANRDHIGMLLAIREGYRLATDAEPEPITSVAATAAVGEELATDTLVPADDESGEQTEADEAEGGEVVADAADLDRDALAEQFKEKFGRLPHGKWSAKRILEELQAEE